MKQKATRNRRVIANAIITAGTIIAAFLCIGATPSQTDFEMQRASAMEATRLNKANEDLRAQIDTLRKDLQAAADTLATSRSNSSKEIESLKNQVASLQQTLKTRDDELGKLRRFQTLVLHPRYGFLRDKVAWHNNRNDPRGGNVGKAAYRELYAPYFGNAAALNRIIDKRFNDDWDSTNDANGQGHFERP